MSSFQNSPGTKLIAHPCLTPVVPKLGVNYLLGIICDSSEGNAEPKPQCCSISWAITAKYWGNKTYLLPWFG